MTRTITSESLLGALLLLALMSAVAVMMTHAGTAPAEAMLRYTLVALIAVAVAPTHVLLPDPVVPWLVRTNPTPGALLRRSLYRFLPTVAALVLPAAGMGMIQGDVVAGTIAVLLILAVSGYAFGHVMSLGPISQAWQEGTRGETYRKILERSPNASFQVPHGLVPPMLASVRVFLVGAGFVLIVGLVQIQSSVGAFVVVSLLLVAIGWRIVRASARFDQSLYQSSALFFELLHGPALQAGAREPVSIEAVYWVPRRWRIHAWAGLVQLDRRVPMGRLFLLGGTVFWGMIAAGVSTTSVGFFLAAGILARNAATLRHRSEDMSPPSFNLSLQSPADWLATRFWMSLRWTLPLILVLAAAAMFSARFSWTEVFYWTIADVAAAGAVALVATLLTEHAHRRRFA